MKEPQTGDWHRGWSSKRGFLQLWVLQGHHKQVWLLAQHRGCSLPGSVRPDLRLRSRRSRTAVLARVGNSLQVLQTQMSGQVGGQDTAHFGVHPSIQTSCQNRMRIRGAKTSHTDVARHGLATWTSTKHKGSPQASLRLRRWLPSWLHRVGA